MEQRRNPFTAGAGVPPWCLEGRNDELADFDVLMERAGNAYFKDQGMILKGVRGVGKTVLLGEMQRRANEEGWLTVWLEADNGEDNATELWRNLAIEARKFSNSKKLGDTAKALLNLFGSGTVGFGGVSLSLTRTDAAPTADNTSMLLTRLVDEMTDGLLPEARVLALFVDEMQSMDSDLLSVLMRLEHKARRECLPFYFFGAGLPTLPNVLPGARTYSERFDVRTIGALPPDKARAVLVNTARCESESFTDEALDILVAEAEGYPYFLQMLGRSIWNIAPSSPFTADDARVATDVAFRKLSEVFFPSRWTRASRSERKYMRAIAETGESQPRTADLQVKKGRASRARESLINKGVLMSMQRGRIGFTTPGMARYILDYTDPEND